MKSTDPQPSPGQCPKHRLGCTILQAPTPLLGSMGGEGLPKFTRFQSSHNSFQWKEFSFCSSPVGNYPVPQKSVHESSSDFASHNTLTSQCASCHPILLASITSLLARSWRLANTSRRGSSRCAECAQQLARRSSNCVRGFAATANIPHAWRFALSHLWVRKNSIHACPQLQ